MEHEDEEASKEPTESDSDKESVHEKQDDSDKELSEAKPESEPEEAVPEVTADMLKKSLASTPPPSPAAGKVEDATETGNLCFLSHVLSPRLDAK